MAPTPESSTFFKAEGGRGQKSPNDLQEMVAKANQLGGSEAERKGVNGILLGPPGAGKGTQVCLICFHNLKIITLNFSFSPILHVGL